MRYLLRSTLDSGFDGFRGLFGELLDEKFSVLQNSPCTMIGAPM
jgi:hypothetical protein